MASRSKQLVAVGVNCSAPVLVEPLLKSAAPQKRPDLSWVVYPDGGDNWVPGIGCVQWMIPSSLIILIM